VRGGDTLAWLQQIFYAVERDLTHINARPLDQAKVILSEALSDGGRHWPNRR
jgi:hypothetical protein